MCISVPRRKAKSILGGNNGWINIEYKSEEEIIKEVVGSLHKRGQNKLHCGDEKLVFYGMQRQLLVNLEP